MIESKLEKIFVERLKNRLEGNQKIEGKNVQVVGSWDVLAFDDTKGEEDSDSIGVLVVKIQPRQYSTATVPITTIQGALSLSVRGDADYNGQAFHEIVSEIMKEMEMLQKCCHSTHDIYSIPDENFEVTGFQLNAGDTAINTTTKVFSYTHSFTVFGSIQCLEM